MYSEKNYTIWKKMLCLDFFLIKKYSYMFKQIVGRLLLLSKLIFVKKFQNIIYFAIELSDKIIFTEVHFS